MAKLIGVKTIDMANGEITKVAYEGEDYAQVENGDVGDIAVITEAWVGLRNGDYYKVNYRSVDTDGDVFIGIKSDGYVGYESNMKYFRKTPAQASPTNTDVSITDVSAKVDAIDARVSALEKAEAPAEFKVGDRVEVVNYLDSHYEDFANGNIGTIVATESLFSDEGYPYEFNRNDDHDYFSASALRKVADAPKPADSITHKDVEYTLVDRKAQVGDVVVFSGNTSVCATNGIPYVASDTKQEKTVFEDAYGTYNVYSEHYNRTEANTLVYAPKVEPLKVGDYVILSGKSLFGVDLVGKVGVYGGPSVYSSSAKAIVEVINEEEYVVKYTDLRKATDAEVAEAKALAEQSAKDAKLTQVFTQAGRKPNEYRKGDIVRVVKDNALNSVNMSGDIGEITLVKPFGFVVHVNSRGNSSNTHGKKSVEPITFVENRLDK